MVPPPKTVFLVLFLSLSLSFYFVSRFVFSPYSVSKGSGKAGGLSNPPCPPKTSPLYIFFRCASFQRPAAKTRVFSLFLSLFLSFSLCFSFRVPCHFPVALFRKGWGAIQTYFGPTNLLFLYRSSFQHAATQNRVFRPSFSLFL